MPLIFLLLGISLFLLPRLRSKPIDKSSLSLLDVNSLYSKLTIWAWLISSKCLSDDVVNLNLLNKAIGPRLTNLISLASSYLFLLAACNTSKFNTRSFFNKEITESSVGILIYIYLRFSGVYCINFWWRISYIITFLNSSINLISFT